MGDYAGRKVAMAYGPLLPPDHHYARYLKAKWYSFDPTTGEFIVDKAALEPRVSADGTEEKWSAPLE